MATPIPEILPAYLSLFRPHFTEPSFTFFGSYILSLFLTIYKHAVRAFQ